MERIIIGIALVIALSVWVYPTSPSHPYDSDQAVMNMAFYMFIDCNDLSVAFTRTDDENKAIAAECSLKATEFARAHGYQGTT